MDYSTPGLPDHHQFPEPAQTHVHWAGDAIQPSHPLLSPSPPAFNLSQHQGLFQWVSSSCQVVKVLEFHFSISPSNEYSGMISKLKLGGTKMSWKLECHLDSKEQWKRDNHPESANPYSTYRHLCFSLSLGLFLFPTSSFSLWISFRDFEALTTVCVSPLLCWAQLSQQDCLWCYQRMYPRWEKTSLLDLDLLKPWTHYQHLRDS